MSNGTIRNALSSLQIKGKPAGDEQDEMKAIEDRGFGEKINLKSGASEHNHSSEALHKRK